MITNLAPYPAMKDSGVPWLGDVPEHWDVQPIGRIGRLFKGNGGSKEDDVASGIPCIRYGDLYTRHEFFIGDTKGYLSPEKATGYTPLRHGDVLFAASGETIEDIGRSAVNLLESEARCGGDILILRPAIDASSKFLGYVADSTASRNQKACMGRGFTVVHIYASQLKRLLIPLPPRPEQDAIVRFLGHVDRRVRRYIRAKQKLIKLLEEQKQAIIHHAVTRGVNPNVRLKHSGVEWLGEVPEHWEVRKLRTLFRRHGSGTTPSGDEYYGGGVPWVVTGDLNDGEVTTTKRTVTHAALKAHSALRMYPPGSLLVAMYGATIGKTGVLALEACTNQACCALADPVESTSVAFLQVVINIARPHLIEQSYGGGQPNINAEIVRSLRVPVPPRPEQEEIVKVVAQDPVVAAMVRIQREIKLLGEYRTRLIADVVTGKFDVREAAARLPHVVDGRETLHDTERETEVVEVEA